MLPCRSAQRPIVLGVNEDGIMADIKKSVKNLGGKAEEMGDKAKDAAKRIKPGDKSKRK